MTEVRIVEKFKLLQRAPGRRWEGKIDEVFAAPEQVAGPGKVRLAHGQELSIDVDSYPVGTVVIVSVPKDAKGYRPRPPVRKVRG